MASYKVENNSDKFSGNKSEDFDIKEKYYYILQNYDLTKLIKNQEQLKLVQSDYLDLNEKLKILDNVLKLRASRYKRNEIILDKEGEDSGSLTLAEPGYYKVIFEGGSGAAKYVRDNYLKNGGTDGKDMSGSMIEDTVYDVAGRYFPYVNLDSACYDNDENCNFFNNVLWPYSNNDGAVFYFSQDLHWYLVSIKNNSTINFKYGSAEVNRTSCFMHREINYDITQESLDVDLKNNVYLNGGSLPALENLVKYLKSNKGNIDKSYIIMFFDLKNFLIANDKGIDEQKFSDYFIYKRNPFTYIEDYEQITLKNESLYLQPNDVFKEKSNIKIVDYLARANTIVIDSKNRKNAFKEWTTKTDEKLVDYYCSMMQDKSCTAWINKPFCNKNYDTKNNFCGGDGGYVTCYIKIDEISNLEYSLVNREPNTFSRNMPKNNFKIYCSKDKSEFSITLENPKNNTSIASGKNGFKLEDESAIDFKGKTLKLNTNIGYAGYDNVNDFRKVSGKPSEIHIRNSNKKDEEPYSYTFVGGGKRGRGITLNKYENAYYEDGGDGKILLQFLGPISSKIFNTTFNSKNCVTSILTNTNSCTDEKSKVITSPSLSTIEFKVNTKDKKYGIDFKKSIAHFTNCQLNFETEKFDLTLAELFEKNSDKLTDKQWAKLNPIYERDDRYDYYYFSFCCLADCTFDIVAEKEENKFFNIDFEANPLKVSSIETTNDYDKRFGDKTTNAVLLNYGVQDYSISIEEYINYNSTFSNDITIVNDYKSIYKNSQLSLENNKFFKIIQSLYQALQLRLFVLNSLDLPRITKYEKKEERWTEVPVSSTKGCYTHIDYSFNGLDFISYLNNEFLTLTNNQTVYFKLYYNTERISIDEASSNITNNYVIYDIDTDIKGIKENNPKEHFQILKVIMDNVSKDINIMLKRNTYTIKFDRCLFNELYPETISGSSEFEAGELCEVRYQMKSCCKLSTHLLASDVNNYFNEAASIFEEDEAKLESQIMLKNLLKKSKFEVLPIIDEFGGYVNPFTTNNGFSHTTTLNSVGGEGVKPFQNPRQLFVNVQIDKIHSFKFSFPQQDVSIRLTADYIVGAKLCEVTQGQQLSLDLLKPGYYYTFIAGGRTGNGGNGGSAASNYATYESGGHGGNGYYAGDGGDGGDTTGMNGHEIFTFTTWHGSVPTGAGIRIPVYLGGGMGIGGIGYDDSKGGLCGAGGTSLVYGGEQAWSEQRSLGNYGTTYGPGQRVTSSPLANRFRGGISSNIFKFLIPREFKDVTKQIMNIFIVGGHLGENGINATAGLPGVSGGAGSSGFPTLARFYNFKANLVKNNQQLWDINNNYFYGKEDGYEFEGISSTHEYQGIFASPGPNASSLINVPHVGKVGVFLWGWGWGKVSSYPWGEQIDNQKYNKSIDTRLESSYGQKTFREDFIRSTFEKTYGYEKLGYGAGRNIENVDKFYSYGPDYLKKLITPGGILGDVNSEFNKNLLGLDSLSEGSRVSDNIFIVPTVEYSGINKDYKKLFSSTSVPDTDCGFILKFLSINDDTKNEINKKFDETMEYFNSTELTKILKITTLKDINNNKLGLDNGKKVEEVNLDGYLNVMIDANNFDEFFYTKGQVIDTSFIAS